MTDNDDRNEFRARVTLITERREPLQLRSKTLFNFKITVGTIYIINASIVNINNTF